MNPNQVVSFAVSTFGRLLIATLTIRAGIIMVTGMLRCDVWAHASATTVFPSRTLRCPMSPVLASEALRWPRDIYADTASDAMYGQVVVYGCISGILGLKTKH